MTIRWEDLKAAEKGWRLDGWKREEILRSCLRGKKAQRFSWRYVGIPAAYLGVTAAVFLLMLFMWPHFKRPQEENTIIIDGAMAQPEKPMENSEPSGEQPHEEPSQLPSDQGEQEPQPEAQIPNEEHNPEQEKQPETQTPAEDEKPVEEKVEQQKPAEQQPTEQEPDQKPEEEKTEEQKPAEEKEETEKENESVQPTADYCIDPKLSSVIRQIEKDCDGTVAAYYGTYNGVVPVMIDGHEVNSAARDVEVEESVFHYSAGENLEVWKDGKLYSLESAYEFGFLTKAQIAIIADYHNNRTYLKMDGLTEEINDPPEDLLEQIKEYYLEWETESDDEFRLYYYGTYSGVAVVDFGSLVTVSLPEIYKPDNLETNTPEVAKIYHLRAWVDGELIPIQHAYVRGAISKEQVQKIESVYENKTMLRFDFE